MRIELSIVILISTTFIGLSAPPAPGEFQKDWLRHRDALLKDPSLERYYTFELAAPGAVEITDAKGGASLKFQWTPKAGQPAGTLQVVEGRWPGKPAVRLDQGCLTGRAFNPSNRAFTVLGWFRKSGPGAHRGNNESPNGTLLATSDGYWSGWRLTTSYPRQQLSFEIGRPKPGSSFGVSGGLAPDGAWNHLAATWDGAELRIYLNGWPAASGKYDGAYTASENAFRIGYNNAGFGSVVLDVDEVAVFTRALTPAEVLRDAFFRQNITDSAAERFERAFAAMAVKDFPAAEQALAGLFAPEPEVTELNGLARLKLAEVMRERKQMPAAAEELAALSNFNSDRIAASARAELLRIIAESSGAGFSPKAIETALALPGLSAKDKVAAQAQLAQAMRQQGNLDGARQLYSKLVEAPGLGPREQLEARLTLGHVHFEAQDYAAARTEYGRIITDTNAPAAARSLAQLRVAQSHARAKDWQAAQAEYARVGTIPGAPAHHAWEAAESQRELLRRQMGQPPRDPAASHRALPQCAIESRYELWVAPDGSDANAGTLRQPFATLARARDEVRKLKTQNPPPTNAIIVHVRSGEYPMRQVLSLGEQDSGTAEKPVIYRAQGGQTPRFTGGRALSGFTPVTDAVTLARLPENARGQVLEMDLRAAGITNFGQAAATGKRADLYLDGELQPLARWPNEGFVKVGELLGDPAKAISSHGIPGNREGKFRYEGDRPSRWGAEPEIWLYGYWFWDWADSYHKVGGVDTASQSLTITGAQSGYGYRKGQRYHALNLLAEVDRPGEWYLDRAGGKLYFWPPSGWKNARISMPLLDGPMITMNGVSHVIFQGLAFEEGRGDGAVITGGTNVLLAGCTFRRFGENGVIINGGANHGIFGCDIHTLGHGGTIVRGGDRKTLTPSGHFIENCHIHDMSRFIHTYTPAVLADGVAISIRHNRFHGCASSAMRIEGNEHLIEFNDIYNVVMESDDQGGADLWGNPTYRGIVFRYNYWHHIGSDEGLGQAGIRLDDAISGVLIYGNVFYKCARKLFGGVQIHGGKENIVDNNIFVDCLGAVSFSAWGGKRWKEFLASDWIQKKLREELDISKPPHSTRYPTLVQLEENADYNHVWRNLVFDCRQFLMRNPGHTDALDNYITSVPPGFVDAAKGNFALPDNAAIYDRFGLRPIPFAEIGLYPHPQRATPPKE